MHTAARVLAPSSTYAHRHTAATFAVRCRIEQVQPTGAQPSCCVRPRRAGHFGFLSYAAAATTTFQRSMAPTAMKGFERILLVPAALAYVLLYLASGPGLEAAETGLVFHVGGPRGWRVPDANTSYGWWAMKNRFHVGDELYFKYDNDSVLVVDREAFDACNATEPLQKFADGSTTVRLGRPGFFCFISGEPGHCEEGQRLIVRVMVHPAEHAPAPGPAYAPAASQPGHGGGGRPDSGSGSGRHPGTSSGAAAVATSVTLAAAMAVLVGLVLLLQ